MLNRRLQVGLVKDTKGKDTEDGPVGPDFAEKVAIVTDSVKRVAGKVVIGVCLYVVLDTARKIAVAEASK
jgi:hypothetical protein